MYQKEQLEMIAALVLNGIVQSEHRLSPESEARHAVAYAKALILEVEAVHSADEAADEAAELAHVRSYTPPAREGAYTADFVPVPYASTLEHLEIHDTEPPPAPVELPRVSEAPPAPGFEGLDKDPAKG